MHWGQPEYNKDKYSESSVIRTSIIRILDYLDHKITLHMTHGLCTYRTNAHTQYMWASPVEIADW